MPGPAFEKAVQESKQLTQKPSTDDLLSLYALYKQTLQSPPIEQSEQPGMFDLKGKAKRKAWQKLVDEGVSSAQAEERYVALVEELKGKYGFDAAKKPEAVGE